MVDQAAWPLAGTRRGVPYTVSGRARHNEEAESGPIIISRVASPACRHAAPEVTGLTHSMPPSRACPGRPCRPCARSQSQIEHRPRLRRGKEIVLARTAGQGPLACQDAGMPWHYSAATGPNRPAGEG